MNIFAVKVNSIRELNPILDEDIKKEINDKLECIKSTKQIDDIIESDCSIRDKECKAINQVLKRRNIDVRVERCVECEKRRTFLRESGVYWRKCEGCRFHEIIKAESDEE